MTLKQMFPAGKLPDKYKHCTQPTLLDLCPDCGSEGSVDTEAEVIIQDHEEREVWRRKAHVWFCSGCEYAKEVQ